jgi:hypothetical protein
MVDSILLFSDVQGLKGDVWAFRFAMLGDTVDVRCGTKCAADGRIIPTEGEDDDAAFASGTECTVATSILSGDSGFLLKDAVSFA